MVVPAFDSEAYHLGSRILLFARNGHAAASHVLLEPATPIINARAVSTTEDSICDKDSSSSFCEKPYQSKDLTLPITICVALPLVAAAGACIYFWNKNRLRERKEDALEAARDYDYGIDESKSKRKKTLPNGLAEKTQGMHRGQISMDMNLSSPYLLPPKLHESRESLSSLARTVDNDHDPYRPVTQYTNSDVGSMRSLHRDPKYVASVYASSTRNNRKSLMPTSPAAAVTKDPFNQPDVPDIPPTPRSLTAPRSPLSASTLAEDPFASPLDRQTTNAPYPEDNSNADLDVGLAEMPSVQEPPSAMIRGDQHVDMPDHAHHMAVELPDDSNNMANFDLGNIPPQLSLTIPGTEAVHQAPYPEINDVQPAYPQNDYNDEPRGRVNRRSLDLTGVNSGSGDFLAAPSVQNKRISIGMRPLPPSDIMDTEDPEYRANRIRSFYKEYFEDYSKSDAPAVPALPRQYQNNGQGYYEDYDANFMGDAYMDPNSKRFVMPYAQPVTRRAMTPPPGGAHRRGPAPPRFRADSALGPRSGSSASQIRPGSSASGMVQRKRDPPAALSTLPNPSKLGDDSLALLSASDFAPPPRVADLVAGRPQSPTIEKVEYAPKKPIATPIVSTFDELAAMPSPHMLRKSSQFTALDFAPPRRFKDPEDASDAGSIRSNRSGLSSAAAHAVRSGAGRVSRLPGDTVFTTNDLSALKPQWGLRP